MATQEILNIVDEQGNIIGEDTRENIHKLGLLHKEIHVWFFTPQGEIVFQRRSLKKATSPGMLHATVGGHVSLGMDFLDTAIKETKEETGLDLNPSDLVFISQVRGHGTWPNGVKNNALRNVYAYKFTGDVKDLAIENDEGLGFEAWPVDRVLNLREEDRVHFEGGSWSEKFIVLFKKLKEMAAQG